MMRTGSGGSCQLTGTHGPTFDSRISCPIETSYFGRNWNSLPGCEPLTPAPRQQNQSRTTDDRECR